MDDRTGQQQPDSEQPRSAEQMYYMTKKIAKSKVAKFILPIMLLVVIGIASGEWLLLCFSLLLLVVCSIVISARVRALLDQPNLAHDDGSDQVASAYIAPIESQVEADAPQLPPPPPFSSKDDHKLAIDDAPPTYEDAVKMEKPDV